MPCKAHAIAVVAEGASNNAEALVAYFREHHKQIGFELRTSTLGHIQRGGAPTASTGCSQAGSVPALSPLWRAARVAF
jgi:6-phosphofructokinase